jgi:hypothetical protein
MLEYHDPAKVDVALLEEMFGRYGNAYLTAEGIAAHSREQMRAARTPSGEVPGFVNDWSEVSIKRREDIRDLFATPFYFGCEADDSLNYTAFNSKANKMGAKIKAMFSSDLGHWDVLDFGDVLAEAHEPVERGLMSEEDFKDFVFTNPMTFQTRVNPDFFKGTVVEGAVGDSLGSKTKAA